MTFVKVTELRSTAGTTVSGSVSSTAGNALVAVAGTSGTTNTPTVTGGGTWTKDASGSHTFVASGVVVTASISSCPSATGGTQTITATTSGAAGGVVFVYEFSFSGTFAKDAASPALATGTGTTATTGSLTNSSTNALFVGMAITDSGANPATMTGTSAGWIYPAGGRELNASIYDDTGSGYAIVSSVAASTSAWTIDSNDWIALIAVYAESGGGGGGSPQQQFTLLGVGSRTLRTPRPDAYRSRRARRRAALTQPFGVDRLISIPNTIRSKTLINT